MVTETSVIEIALPEVALDEVYQAEGADYSKRSPRPGIVKLHQRILAEASSLVHPVAVWREVEVTGAGEQEVLLEEGLKLNSRLLAKVAGASDKLIFFAVTIGSAIDDRVAEYNKAGDIMAAFALDATGTAFIVKSSMSVVAELEKQGLTNGMSLTFPMGPGHSYWSDLKDMRTIFSLLKAEQIGLRLTDSNLMMPRKSIAMVMGAGRNLQDFKDKTHCDFCNLQSTCNMSKFTAVC